MVRRASDGRATDRERPIYYRGVTVTIASAMLDSGDDAMVEAMVEAMAVLASWGRSAGVSVSLI